MSLQKSAPSDVFLVGTWKLKINRSAANLPPFLALHTYFADGTMIETTSELGKGGEGPGHGVWKGLDEGYVGMYELFLFSDCGNFAGTARVTTLIHFDDPDHLSGTATVDLITLDGKVEPTAEITLFEGTRVKITPVDH